MQSVGPLISLFNFCFGKPKQSKNGRVSFLSLTPFNRPKIGVRCVSTIKVSLLFPLLLNNIADALTPLKIYELINLKPLKLSFMYASCTQ